MKAKRFSVFIFLIVLFVALVSAHSSYLFNINLDFDKEIKSNVVKSAQKFLNTNKEPIDFDLDKGLIIAHFEPEQRNYLEINPIGFVVQGMRNENLKHKAGTKKMTKEQGFEIAKKFFDSLPEKIKSELEYYPEFSEVDGTHFYKWYRYIDGILVVGEDLIVNIDAVNGNIIAWRLSIFDYPKESIQKVPAVSKNVATKVAELSFNAPSVKGFKPYTIINGKELVWVNRLQGQFYPFFVGVSAADGSIAFTGTIPGEVPKEYDVGNELQAVESDFVKQIYNSK
ncbi:MAG: hypothetical protein AABX33_00870 [Nanoarchaeota archaeon]